MNRFLNKINHCFTNQKKSGSRNEMRRPNRDEQNRELTQADAPQEDEIPGPPTDEERKQLIIFAKNLKGRILPYAYDDVDDDDIVVVPEEHGYTYIEEALKGEDMNPTWKQKIFSQRPQDDDPKVREEIDRYLKYYPSGTAHFYWVEQRYAVLEKIEYEKDLHTTQGFDVGYYPYLSRNSLSGSVIQRFYCPPDVNIPAHNIAHLHDLAKQALDSYNFTMGTNYCLVNVIKTMTDVAAGIWYYITFTASCYDDQLWTFETKLFQSHPFPHPFIKVDFVRLKVGQSGPSSSNNSSLLNPAPSKL